MTKIVTLLFSQLMEEFKRAHQKMFNSAQQKTQAAEQVSKEVQEKVSEDESTKNLFYEPFILKIA